MDNPFRARKHATGYVTLAVDLVPGMPLEAYWGLSGLGVPEATAAAEAEGLRGTPTFSFDLWRNEGLNEVGEMPISPASVLAALRADRARMQPHQSFAIRDNQAAIAWVEQTFFGGDK